MKRNNFGKLMMLAALATTILTSTLLMSACYVSTSRYDLKRPVTTQDWLMIWEDPAEVTAGALQNPDFRIRAGDPIFDLAAPLENYLEVLPLGTEPDRSSDGLSLDDWIDPVAPVMYFLPLYDTVGDRKNTLLVWREQHAAMVAHSFDDEFQKYIEAKDELDAYLSTLGKAGNQHQIYWSWLGVFVMAQTAEGESYGLLFSDFPLPRDSTLPLQHSYYRLSSQVLSEGEIVEALKSIHDSILMVEESLNQPIDED
jgi:hypothetical protein